MLNDFIYDQKDNVCSIVDKTNCEDQFSYIPYGEWVGYGETQKTEISITPVVKDSLASVQASKAAEEPAIAQLEQAPIIVNSSAVESTSTCEDNTAIMIAFALGCVAMLVPIGVFTSKIRNLKDEEEDNELAKFEEPAATNRALKSNTEECATEQDKQVV